MKLHVEQHRRRATLVMLENLLRDFKDKLVEAKIHFCLNLVVQKLLSEFGECKVARVGVEVERLEDELHHAWLLRLQNVVGQDPRQRHFDRELDPLAHCQLEVKLTEPHLGQVTALRQRF